MLASKLSITSVFGTWVVIIARDRLVNNLSRLFVTPVTSTSVVIVNNYRAEHTSSIWVARINSTWVLIVTLNLFKDGSNSFITSNGGTFIYRCKRSSGKYTSLNWVTAVVSTDILVITSDKSVLASFFSVAGINGTCIVIITVNLRKDTSNL
jgi:hypothetical protein